MCSEYNLLYLFWIFKILLSTEQKLCENLDYNSMILLK